MLRPTFIAAPRLEGIQEEDDHSGSHGSHFFTVTLPSATQICRAVIDTHNNSMGIIQLPL